MLQFENGDLLYFLVGTPLLVLLFWLAMQARRRSFRRFGHADLIPRLAPMAARYKHTVKFGLLLAAICLIIIAWANPQVGSKKEKVERKSISIFFALDVSQSMWAEDVAPSRLERAKRFAMQAIQKLRSERLGLIVFAGNAYLQSPLTDDYGAMALLLNSANPNMLSEQGTAIGEAVQLAQESFEVENKSNKALILITDGENHEDEAMEKVRNARADGMVTFTIGVGTEEGSFIPTSVGGRRDYKRDNTGNPVLSKINPDLLTNIAEAGDGSYFNLSSGDEAVLEALQSRLDKMEKRTYEQRSFEEYNSYYQPLLLLALLLIVIEFIISYRKNRYLADKDLFKA